MLSTVYNIKIAKYIFLYVDIDGWKSICSDGNAFVTEVIEDIYYSLDKDLRWNLYLICVVRDEDLANIDRYEKRHFESNIKYTRNFLLSELTLTQRIPIGKVLMNSNQHKIRYPLVDWQAQLQGYEFCMNDHSEESLLENLTEEKCKDQEELKVKEVLHKSSLLNTNKTSNNIYKEYEKIKIQELYEIKVPKMFRPHLYTKDWILPCCKFNLLFGANGTGKTSVLSAVELTVTGTIEKPKKNVADCADRADVQLKILYNNKIETLDKPSKMQKEVREAEWYNYYGSRKTETQLDSLFHKFNYFSIDDSYRFASGSSENEDIFSCLIYGENTIKIWNNIQANCEKCAQISRRLQREYENIYEQIHQPPPMVDKIYDDIIKKNIKEIGLQIPNSASLIEIVDIISDITIKLAEMSNYKPIVSKVVAENRIQEIDNLILSVNKQEIKLERKIKRYKTFQASANKICIYRIKGNDEVKICNLEMEKEKKS